MGGGLLQLVAYGAQDVYLTGNPQITFFKAVYRRHTNFAIEAIEQTFNGTPDFGSRVTCQISRNGDLINRVYLQLRLTPLTDSYCKYFGLRVLNYVEIEIGGQRIDKQYGQWLHIWNELTQEPGKQAGYAKMVGNVPELTNLLYQGGSTCDNDCYGGEPLTSEVVTSCAPMYTLYIPLQFWFCRNPGLALPLIALQYHEVRVNVQFQTVQNCAWLQTAVQPSTYGSLLAASLWVDYCYLDTEERRRFAQQSHEYLIEQVQFTGAESITSSSNKIQLNFNHPVKELFWVVQRDSFVDCSSTSAVNASLYGPQPFNYSDDFDTSIWALSSGSDSVGSNVLQGTGESVNLGGAGTVVATTAGALGSTGTVEYLLPFLLSKVILASGIRCEGKNPVEVAKLQLNGQDRFTEREGSYFDTVQPYQHHSRTPSRGINCYSFALRPEEHQPSGTCNFSRIDKATLQLTVSVATVAGANTAQVRVYALNYNVLRVMSGMGGLAYSN